MLVVIKAPMVTHQPGQYGFARMPKWWMAKIVCQADRFNQVFVCAEGAGYGPAYLSDFQCVSQTCTIIIAFIRDEDLGFILQTAKSRGVQNPIPVPLECCSIFRFLVWINPSLGMLAANPVGSQAAVLKVFDLFSLEYHSIAQAQVGDWLTGMNLVSLNQD